MSSGYILGLSRGHNGGACLLKDGKIIFALEDKELSVTEITKVTGLSQPLVSFHLKALNEAGLIEKFRKSSFVFNKLTDQNLLFLIRSFIDFSGGKFEINENDDSSDFPFPPWK